MLSLGIDCLFVVEPQQSCHARKALDKLAAKMGADRDAVASPVDHHGSGGGVVVVWVNPLTHTLMHARTQLCVSYGIGSVRLSC